MGGIAPGLVLDLRVISESRAKVANGGIGPYGRPDLKPDLGLDPSAMPADWEAGRQHYFTINWIRLAVSGAAFALFILTLSFL